MSPFKLIMCKTRANRGFLPGNCPLTTAQARGITKIWAEFRLRYFRMRHPTLLISSLLAIALSATCAAQQILTNGSFESGLTGWTASGSYPVSPVRPVTVWLELRDPRPKLYPRRRKQHRNRHRQAHDR